MTAPAPAIPSFALYGEGHAPSPAGFGHIETIALRSSLHDWEITPHRHTQAIQVLIVQAGEARVMVDGARFALPCPGFVVVAAGAVHGFRFAQGTCGIVMTLGQDFGARAGRAADPLARLATQGGHGALDPQGAARIERLTGEMLALSAPWQSDAALFHALAEAVLRSLPQAAPTGPNAPDAAPDERRLAQFRGLVEAHLADPRPLAHYADAMGVTERTLSRLVQRRMGCTPLEAVNRRRALEAQRLLRYTNASVTQVAHVLGFADPSYFSRFYLRLIGHRPQAERQPDLR